MQCPQSTIRSLLSGGDRRSIGRADEVARLVLRQPKQFARLIECLHDSDEIIRMRAADAAEKVSRKQAALLQPHKAELLHLLANTKQKEAHWHLAVMIPRLQLSSEERRWTVEALQMYLEDRSSIVKTSSMQGLFDLAQKDAQLRLRTAELLASLTNTGTPAMHARGRKLLQQLEDSEPSRSR